MSDPTEQAAKVPSELGFFAALGHATFAGQMLQCMLADVYGISFEDTRDGCLPRVFEKRYEAYSTTLGGAIRLTSEFLPPGLRLDLEWSLLFRNYIAHRLVWETRGAQGTEEGRDGLVDRLQIVSAFLGGTIKDLQAHQQDLFRKSGVSDEALAEHYKPWDELGDPKTGHKDEVGDLRTAGITRTELFERSATRQPIRLHDLRATFVTVSLANGKSEAFVSDRTGHKSSQMLAAYTRQARMWGELGLGTLQPLDELLPEMNAPKPAATSPDAEGDPSNPSAPLPLPAGEEGRLARVWPADGSDCRTRTYDPAINRARCVAAK